MNEVSKFIEENHDKIKSIQSAGTGLIEYTSKVVGTVTNANGTNPDGIPNIVGTQLAPPSNIGLRDNWVDSLTSTVAGSVRGLYMPKISRKRPSRGFSFSAATIR